jgi:hypothetical protein
MGMPEGELNPQESAKGHQPPTARLRIIHIRFGAISGLAADIAPSPLCADGVAKVLSTNKSFPGCTRGDGIVI